MKSLRLLLAAVTLTVTLLLTLAVQTAAASSSSKAPPPIDPRILIKTVDESAGTVEIEYMRDAKEPTHVYTIDDLTTIQVNDDPGKISDIKAGMQVREYVERDGHTLDKITVSKADPAPVAPK
jgi:hypothetical protein